MNGYRRNRVLLLVLLVAMLTTCLMPKVSMAKGKSFSGTWKAIKKDSFGRSANVIIKKKIIRVYWIKGTSKSLYWYGSWNPKKKNGKYVVKSKNNHKKTSGSLFASGDKYKKFTIKNGVISFSSSMMGITDKISVKKK